MLMFGGNAILALSVLGSTSGPDQAKQPSSDVSYEQTCAVAMDLAAKGKEHKLRKSLAPATQMFLAENALERIVAEAQEVQRTNDELPLVVRRDVFESSSGPILRTRLHYLGDYRGQEWAITCEFLDRHGPGQLVGFRADPVVDVAINLATAPRFGPSDIGLANLYLQHDGQELGTTLLGPASANVDAKAIFNPTGAPHTAEFFGPGELESIMDWLGGLDASQATTNTPDLNNDATAAMFLIVPRTGPDLTLTIHLPVQEGTSQIEVGEQFVVRQASAVDPGRTWILNVQEHEAIVDLVLRRVVGGRTSLPTSSDSLAP